MGLPLHEREAMRSFLLATLLAAAVGCGTDTGTYVNALSGKTCDPNGSYKPHPNHGNGPSNDKCQGTSNGDNCDDLSSGKIDCIGDGNSGQGDDKKHNCQFPQPGCDDQGCCEDDLVDPPPGDGDDGEDDPPPPPDDGETPPPDDGETPPPPPEEDPDGPIFI